MKFMEKINRLWAIASVYDDDKEWTRKKINHLERENKLTKDAVVDAIDIHADVRSEMSSFVIVVGRLRKHDFVKCYNVYDESLQELTNHLQHVSQRGRVGRLDHPHPEVRQILKREFKSFEG